MKKKSMILVVLLFFITVAVVYAGYNFSNKQQKELIQAISAEGEKKESVVPEESVQENDISFYESQREQLSIIDYIKYIELTEKKPAIAFYGQSTEDADWVDNVTLTLEASLSNGLESTSFLKPETDSYDLYITNAAQSLTETSADVVFFMTPALGDQIRDVSIEDSKDYLDRNVNQIQEMLPDALVVLVTPAPNDESEDYNSRMLTYIDYKDAAVEVAEEIELPLFDIHGKYLDQLEQKDASVETMVEENGVTLNEEGNQLMSEIFNEELTVPVDTTSGLGN